MILKRWDNFSHNDRDLYVIKGKIHDIKAVFEKAMTRLDSKGEQWVSDLYEERPSNFRISMLVAMAEEYSETGWDSTLLEKLRYKRKTSTGVRPLDEADCLDVPVKEEPKAAHSKEEPKDVEGSQESIILRAEPAWINQQHNVANKTVSGLEMFTLASVIVDSNGINWHCTDVEFANLNPSPKYLTKHEVRSIALRNIALNGQSPERLSRSIKEWYR
ncbi:hypothetical protein IQ07DRAFT_338354 [Pyrenochaeta sp. DS3sAY3a]|nr:hypothetical protein IQ07DRAFT_338354 [Pyrenochaeta sp. DS3sAY3a]